MVQIVLLVLGSVAGLALGIWLGWRWGMALARASGSSAKYWLANGAVTLLGLGVSVVGLSLDATWFAVSGMGIMAGGITGLKYGYGQSPGVWAVHDRLMGIDPPGGADDAGDADQRDPTRRAP